MNYLFISPNFPQVYTELVIELAKHCKVFGLGDAGYGDLNYQLQTNLSYYHQVDLNNFDQVVEKVEDLINRYGNMDIIESHNEHWLYLDARLRQRFGVKGITLEELDFMKAKSKMKQVFSNAKVDIIRYQKYIDLDSSLKFGKLVNYPLFAKPDIGVGAMDSYKIRSQEQLQEINHLLNNNYILEEYMDGDLVSYDGIVDYDGNVICDFNEEFTTPIFDIVSKQVDMYYYAHKKIDPEIAKLGQAIVKEFNIRARFFHIEFFKHNNKYVALEVNMRPPGGNTINLLSLNLQYSLPEIYAKMIAHIPTPKSFNRALAVSINRRRQFDYEQSIDQIKASFPDNVKLIGQYPTIIASAMCDDYIMASFSSLTEMNKFIRFSLKKKEE
jgi:hypothetical protein